MILKTTPGLDTRPTIDRIKETLFNIINPYIPGAAFLDLFAGSGSIGIEALSRGASFAAFVDNNQKAVQCIKDNLAHTKLAEDALVIRANALNGIKELAAGRHHFDLVYMDPPYHLGVEEETLCALSASGIIDKDTLVIVEADKHNQLDFIESTDFEVIREKEYKTNKHYFLKIRS